MKTPKTRREFGEMILVELNDLTKWAQRASTSSGFVYRENLQKQIDALKERVKKLGGIDEGAE